MLLFFGCAYYVVFWELEFSVFVALRALEIVGFEMHHNYQNGYQGIFDSKLLFLISVMYILARQMLMLYWNQRSFSLLTVSFA